jgi:hypothetical protein
LGVIETFGQTAIGGFGDTPAMDLEASLRLFPPAYECGVVKAIIGHIWIDIKC